MAPSSPPWPVSPLAPPGSLVPPAPPWSVVEHPSHHDYTSLAVPRPSVPLAPSGSSFPSAPPWSSVAPATPRPSGSTPLPRSPEPPVPPWSSRSSSLPWLFGSLSRALPPPAPLPSVSPLSCQPFLHHGSSLRRLHRGSLLWLWPGSHLAPPAPSLSGLLPGSFLCLISPGSSLHCLHHGLYLPAPPGCPSSSEASSLCCSHPYLPMLFLRREDAPSGRGAICHASGLFVCVFLPMCSLWPSFSHGWSCNLVQVCRVNCPHFPMYLSPSLCCMSLSGLNRHVRVSPAIPCVDLPCAWIILKTVPWSMSPSFLLIQSVTDILYVCMHVCMCVYIYIYIYTYSISQKWVHPSHFGNQFSIYFQGTIQ